MKKLELLCVGRIKEDYLNAGINEYLKRLSRYCAASVREIPDRKDDVGAVEAESADILAAQSGYTVLADLRGKELTSEQLAAALEKAYLTRDKVQFVIGGSRGVTDEVRKRADLVVSFGKFTFPHRLMRLIVVEQLYRAFTIGAGTAYHK